MCWIDINGSGTIADEPLAHYITFNTTIVAWNAVNATRIRNGDIVLYSEEYRPRLSSAVLGTTITRTSNDTFKRYISDPDYGETLGWMQVEGPVPNPEATFGGLGRNPLLVDIPEGLRSAVDPALLLPLSDKVCSGSSRCIVTVAVSPKIQLLRLFASDIG